jgi:Tfp pilus tip-associated adhesin PilY1
MPVNYGSGNVAIYYGANDGLFRAVNASTGKEMWAFLAPEFTGKIERLRSNTTKIFYPNTIYAPSDVTAPKDYFFDGGIGIYQTAATTGADAHTWIYPAMRRGGRLIYALDVTTSTGSGSSFNVVPELKWRFGCAPNATCYAGQATTADADVAQIGQTWSQPTVTPLRVPGATVSDPQENLLAVVFGGGYDNCEDSQLATPACGATKGNRVYVVNAATGALIRAFTTERAVAAELVLADVNSDGKADFAYAVDLGGNIYRINFVNASNEGLAPANWDMQKIAQTSAPGRKFHYPPVILVNQGKVYLGIGSGDREHPLIGDYPYTNTATYPHRFYVYLDAPVTHCPIGTTSCATDNLDNTSLMNNVTGVTSCTDASLNIIAGGAKKGWFRSLTQGEQVVTGAVITAGAVNFSTNKPEAAAALACRGSLGEARGYRLDFFSGLPAITNSDGTCSTFQDFAGGGLPPSPVIARIKIYDDNGEGKLVTACVGCASEDGTKGGSGLGGGRFKPTISAKRTRTYWYSEADKSN